MRATPLLVRWHEENAPIYSAAFEPGPKARLATAGGDNNVRLWKIESNGEERKVTYLSTLSKHTQAVNVVRWCPRGEMLSSAGDDGNVLLWVPSENPTLHRQYGDDGQDDKESWRVKTMCRSSGSEIYDLAWSPDGIFFITGSMDNVARIYNASNGNVVRQIAEHNHYVQGVAWDPLNEYIATQSSDRSVHIYTLKTKDGQFTLAQHNKVTKMDMPTRRISSNSPVPTDLRDFRGRAQMLNESALERAVGSPLPSAPGTPQSLALPMNPPPTTHSRRSSFGSAQSIRRSVSPSPSIPLPAVMPTASPNIFNGMPMNASKSTSLYANETFMSFFRRLTFAPDGSLLFTPAGQHKEFNPPSDQPKHNENVLNMTYIYTRAGLNKPPVAKLPGHKKPSLAVRCSSVLYTHRLAPAVQTKDIIIDTGSTEADLSPLPEPAISAKPAAPKSMDPPASMGAPSPAASLTTAPSPKIADSELSTVAHTPPPSGPPPMFDLPYRIVYAVATQDAVHVYDTQQRQPLCVVSNLHFATFTDLSWSNDGLTLFMTSSDGFCSCLVFAPGELGTPWQAPPHARPLPGHINTSGSSSGSTPLQTPTQSTIPLFTRPSSSQGGQPPSASPLQATHPASPARSMSMSSATTEQSHAHLADQSSEVARMLSNSTPHISSVPGLTATATFTPPQTPGYTGATVAPAAMIPPVPVAPTAQPQAPASVTMPAATGTKREAEPLKNETGGDKKRRVAPTLVSGEGALKPPQPLPVPTLAKAQKSGTGPTDTI